MFCMSKKKKIYPAYVSQNNSNHEKLLFNNFKRRKIMAWSYIKKTISIIKRNNIKKINGGLRKNHKQFI